MENKPDFERLATHQAKYQRLFQNADRDYIVWENGWTDGCEHVWNTHVVPLQDQSSITIDRIESENDSYKRRCNQLESENKALREEIERLKINQPPFR